jgi:hypothetical protein
VGFVLHVAELGVGVVWGLGARALERLIGALFRVDSFHSSA